MTRKIRAKADTYSVITNALEYGIERGMNRCDKYSEEALTEGQRALLVREIDTSFMLYLEEHGITLEG